MNSSLIKLRDNLTLTSNYLRYAIRLMLSCTFTVFLYQYFHFENGYWAAFSVIACVWPTQGLSLQRAVQRIIGTFIGVCFGIVLAHSFGYHLLVLDIVLPLFIFLTFYLKAYSYSLYVLCMTVLTVLFICLIVPGDWQVGIVRLNMTLLGTLIALVATLFIFPSRISKLLPQQLKEVQRDIQQYYLAICQSYGKKSAPILRDMQLQAFKNLQTILTNAQEARYEYVHVSNRYQGQRERYQILESLYQNLLALEIHVPQRIQQQSLQDLSQSLENLLFEIVPLLLQFDLDLWSRLIDRLNSLHEQVRQQRSIASKDLNIQTATLHEHIQLDIFILSLKVLLINLKVCAELKLL